MKMGRAIERFACKKNQCPEIRTWILRGRMEQYKVDAPWKMWEHRRLAEPREAVRVIYEVDQDPDKPKCWQACKRLFKGITHMSGPMEEMEKDASRLTGSINDEWKKIAFVNRETLMESLKYDIECEREYVKHSRHQNVSSSSSDVRRGDSPQSTGATASTVQEDSQNHCDQAGDVRRGDSPHSLDSFDSRMFHNMPTLPREPPNGVRYSWRSKRSDI